MAYTTINKGSSYFNTVLYTGTGASNSVTGVGFKPDWVWIKSRSLVRSNQLNDIVRGAGIILATDNTSAEFTDTNRISSFNVDGFSLGTNDNVNGSGATYVGWNWLGSNTTTSNTSGTITSTVSANTTSGFSIVGYTGNLTNGATVGHGLGVAPSMMIVKRRNNADNWIVYNRAMSSSGDYYLYLQSTDAKSNLYNQFYDTAPTSSVFYLSNSNATNASGDTYIAYCFAEVKGYSKFGSYTGNGSTDGTFVYTGFKPAFVMTKSSSTGGTYYDWGIMDNKRANSFNVINAQVCANLSDEENSANIGSQKIDFLSNGFKPRVNGSSHNASGVTYIYMAFAENPFVTSGGIPVTAR